MSRPSRIGNEPGSSLQSGRQRLISVVVPCFNEERYIGRCLDSILASEHPQESLEVIVVDGGSTDETVSILRTYGQRYRCIQVLHNPARSTPAALNLGIKHARGDVVLRMDAHTTYPEHYISRLVSWLDSSGADNVGGTAITLPADTSAVAEAVAAAMSHPFGVGNVYFRIGTRQPRWVDTVPFGCYRKDLFSRVGLFDEELSRNQDDEFNHRLIKRGGRILLVPDVHCHYYARSTLRQLWQMYYEYGYMKPLVARKVGAILTFRQVVPALFVVSLTAAGVASSWSHTMRFVFATIGAAYVLADILASASQLTKQKAQAALALLAAFPVMHFAYALGFLRGIVDFLLLRRTPRSPKYDAPSSR